MLITYLALTTIVVIIVMCGVNLSRTERSDGSLEYKVTMSEQQFFFWLVTWLIILIIQMLLQIHVKAVLPWITFIGTYMVTLIANVAMMNHYTFHKRASFWITMAFMIAILAQFYIYNL